MVQRLYQSISICRNQKWTGQMGLTHWRLSRILGTWGNQIFTLLTKFAFRCLNETSLTQSVRPGFRPILYIQNTLDIVDASYKNTGIKTRRL